VLVLTAVITCSVSPLRITGYSQLDVTLNCYLRPDRFDGLPNEPTLHKQGCEAFLVSLVEGTLKDIPGMEVIRALSSFRCVTQHTAVSSCFRS
jgi:hypothetical protein